MTIPRSWTPPQLKITDNHLDVFETLYWHDLTIPVDSYLIFDDKYIEVDSQQIPINELSDCFDYNVVTYNAMFCYQSKQTLNIYDHQGNVIGSTMPISLSPTKKGWPKGKPRKPKEIQVHAEPFDQSKVQYNIDPINPDYYKRLPFEVIEVTERYDFCVGNALKYLMRAGHKPGNSELQDLKKAHWYLERARTHGTHTNHCGGDEAFRVAHLFPGDLGSAIYYAMTSDLMKSIHHLNKIIQCAEK